MMVGVGVGGMMVAVDVGGMVVAVGGASVAVGGMVLGDATVVGDAAPGAQATKSRAKTPVASKKYLDTVLSP